jgi:hypothetical protein
MRTMWVVVLSGVAHGALLLLSWWVFARHAPQALEQLWLSQCLQLPQVLLLLAALVYLWQTIWPRLRHVRGWVFLPCVLLGMALTSAALGRALGELSRSMLDGSNFTAVQVAATQILLMPWLQWVSLGLPLGVALALASWAPNAQRPPMPPPHRGVLGALLHLQALYLGLLSAYWGLMLGMKGSLSLEWFMLASELALPLPPTINLGLLLFAAVALALTWPVRTLWRSSLWGVMAAGLLTGAMAVGAMVLALWHLAAPLQLQSQPWVTLAVAFGAMGLSVMLCHGVLALTCHLAPARRV